MNRFRLCAAAALLLYATVATSAQGVLERVAAGGKLVLAHQAADMPFSYLHEGKPQGYAIDLCLRFAEAVRRHTGMKNMAVQWVLIAPADRVDVVAQGRADMECGSTTNNAERRQKVAFTIPHFITGSRLLVRASSPVKELEDLRGKKLVSTAGTTPLERVSRTNREQVLGIDILVSNDHLHAVTLVEKGEAEAFAMDDVMLYSLAASRPDPKALKLVGRMTTTEPLAMVLPKNDPAFKKVIDEEMRRLISSREIYALYDQWFLQPIAPQGRALGLGISRLLRDFWKYPTDQVPF